MKFRVAVALETKVGRLDLFCGYRRSLDSAHRDPPNRLGDNGEWRVQDIVATYEGVKPALRGEAWVRTWAQLICLEGGLADAEPKRLQDRPLHVAAVLVHRGRRLIFRLDETGPWAAALRGPFLGLRTVFPRQAGSRRPTRQR